MHSARWLILAVALALAGQVYPPGPQVLVFTSDVDGTAQPYALYVPKNFDASRRYPLVVSLHSEGSNHRLDLRRVFGKGNVLEVRRLGRGGLIRQTDAEAANGPFPPLPDVDFFVVSPLVRGSMGYQGIPEKDVYDVLAQVNGRFPIDEDRIYLTGAAMGGAGALWLGLTRPDLWAAIAVVCPVSQPGTEELAPNALGLPVRLFQGALDPQVPAESTRAWEARLEQAGAKVGYTEYPYVRHNAWDSAYSDASIFRWFVTFRRERFPARVHFSSRSYEYGSAYWVRLDGLTPGTLATIDARVTANNRVEIQTSALDGFTLRLDGHPQYDAAKPLVALIDGQEIKGSALSFAKTDKGWMASRYIPPQAAKRPGQEGPIRQALARKHLYIYGTADSPDENELASRRAQAERAANWVSPPWPLLLSLGVRSDREVTEKELEGADLVLFGSRQTNSLIARFGDRVAFELNPSAADYGMVAIAPAGDRYIVVSSGLPWWAGAPPPAKPGASPPPVYKALLELGDYVVFRSSLANVVAEGLFDRNWKLPAGEAAKLATSGLVHIR